MVRAVRIYVSVSFIIGPSTDICVVIGLIPALPANSFLFPSFDPISRTEEILPPYRLEFLLYINVTSFIISELTAEKNPKK